MTRVEIPQEFRSEAIGYVYSAFVEPISSASLAYSNAVYKYSTFSLREFEGARARVANINGCLLCQQYRTADHPEVWATAEHTVGLRSPRGEAPDESFFAEIDNWRTATLYSVRERLAIEFAERFCQDPKGFEADEYFWQQLHENFSDAELVELSFTVGSFMNAGRITHVLGLDGFCALPASPVTRTAELVSSEGLVPRI